MQTVAPPDGPEPSAPNVTAYKHIIAKVILFKAAQKIVRPMFPAFQANVTAYVVSLVANRLGPHIDLERIWNAQAVSGAVQHQIHTWAEEVNRVLHASSNGRMISEWAKKPECWEAVVGAKYSAPAAIT
jgi:hypothetical protein